MNIGDEPLKVDPFGNVRPLPKCPYCDKVLSWWAVQNIQHTDGCTQNPKNIALKKMCEQLQQEIKKALKGYISEDQGEGEG